MKRFSILLCMFFFGLTGAQTYAQDNVPAFVEHLKQTSVLILAGGSKTIAGTGFLTLNGKNQVMVVTNKHVINKGKPLFVRVNAEKKVVDYPADVYRLSQTLDLGILALKKAPQAQSWVSTDLIIPKSMYGIPEDLKEGMDVIYIGYPLGLGAEEKNYPLTRGGMVAQAIPGRKTFLVDGFASHGNSGSPVFNRKDGKLVGVVSSFEPDFIDSYEQKRLLSRIPFNSGLSRVISIEAIQELLNMKK